MVLEESHPREPTPRWARWWASFRRAPRSLRIGLALGLGILGILGLTTDSFRSNRAVVARAVANLAAPQDHEVRFLVDVRTNPQRVGAEQFTHLHFRAGPGPLLRAGTGRPKTSWPFSLTLRKPGLSLFFRGSTIIRDGAGFVRLTEMPPYKKLRDVLQGRWLQIGEPQRAAATPPGHRSEQTPLFFMKGLVERKVLRAVRSGRTEVVRGVNGRVYDLEFDDAGLRAYLQGLSRQPQSDSDIVYVARYLDGRLAVLRIDRARLWVRSRSGAVIRARLELVPRDASSPIRRVVTDATILPRTGGNVPEAPKGAVRLHPETLRKLVPSS